MKTLVVFSIVIALGALGPQRALTNSLEPLWVLGMAGIVAFLFQQMCQRLKLAPVSGWLCAGVVLGLGGFPLLGPKPSFPIDHTFAIVATWVGFDVGIRMRWQSPLRWPLLTAIGINSLLVGVTVVVALVLVLELPVWVAILFGALTSFWGPIFMGATETPDDELRFASLVGTGTGLVLLTSVLALSYSHGPFGRDALQFAGKICLSLTCGALAAEVVRNLKFFATRPSALAVSMLGVVFVAAAVIVQTGLLAVMFGLSAGVCLARTPEICRRSCAVLDTSQPIAFMVLFVLIGVSIDPFSFTHPPHGFLPIFLVQVAVLLVARLLLPRLSRHLFIGNGRQAWMWIPRGVLMFEVANHFNAAGGFLPAPWPQLIRQVVHAEILLHGLVMAPIALALMEKRHRPGPEPELATATIETQ